MSLSADDAREIARLLTLLLGHPLRQSADSTTTDDFAATLDQPRLSGRALLAARARAFFFERKRRLQFFNPAMFGEPAWDMLLALYITDFSGGRQTVGKLISWVGVPQTTALRWIDYLEKERLVARDPQTKDRRIIYVDLTEKGRTALEQYLGTLDDTFGTLLA